MKKMLLSGLSVLLLLISPIFILTACGCNGGKTPSLTTSGSEPSIFTFKNQFLSFDYGTEWRVSGQTDSSIVLTHKEKPGDVLFSVRWVETQVSGNSDLGQLYSTQLALLATEVQRLEDIKISEIKAERYASLITRDDQRSVVTMDILFKSDKTAYLITFSAVTDDFVACAAGADQVINTIRIP